MQKQTQYSFQPMNARGGVFMIGMGLVFLASTSGIVRGEFVGLFFASAPILMLWTSAWHQYRQNEYRFDSRVASFLLWSMMPPIAILFYYLDINMANIGAISCIFAGLTIILNRNLRTGK